MRIVRHPTFDFDSYILQNTKRNQDYFLKKEDAEANLIFLGIGGTGVDIEDEEIIN